MLKAIQAVDKVKETCVDTQGQASETWKVSPESHSEEALVLHLPRSFHRNFSISGLSISGFNNSLLLEVAHFNVLCLESVYNRALKLDLMLLCCDLLCDEQPTLHLDFFLLPAHSWLPSLVVPVWVEARGHSYKSVVVVLNWQSQFVVAFHDATILTFCLRHCLALAHPSNQIDFIT